MSEQRPLDPFEQRLRDAAQRLEYPSTPDIAGTVRERLRQDAGHGARRISGRRLVGAGLAFALLLAALLAVPQVRAAIVEILRLGAVQFVYPTVTPLAPTKPPAPIVSNAPTARSTATSALPTATVAPSPTVSPGLSLTGLRGETTLEALRPKLPFQLRLPGYPANLGPPDRVFLQELGGPIAMLAWVDRANRDQPGLTLYEMGQGVAAEKMMGAETRMQETTVNGNPAVWVTGPHLFDFLDRGAGPDFSGRRRVTGNVLIWTQNVGPPSQPNVTPVVTDQVTYRLESNLPLEEAIKVAESLR